MFDAHFVGLDLQTFLDAVESEIGLKLA